VLFSEQTIYVQIEKDRFKLLHVQSGKTAQVHGNFSNARLAIANFTIAADVLKKGVFEVYPKSFIRFSPTLVIHQTYNTEGGLCEIEERILKEAALSTGAKQVFVWQGQPLTETQLLDKVFKKT